MPVGPFGEILGTTGTLGALGPDVTSYKSNVVAPRNPKLVRQNAPDKHKMTPSKFLFEMSLSTEEKLANTRTMRIPCKTELLDMGDTSLQKFSKVNIDEPMFQPFPSEIYFQNFKPFEVYEVPLALRNNDKVPRLIKITQESSPYFKIISPNDVGHKVGPGLPTTFRVQFMPDEKKDYKHEFICITEREKFIVPVKAIGARGILDLPDNIHFPSCLVKYPNTKTLLVRNIGSKEAKFILKAKAPFYVSPDIGSLDVNKGIQLTVEFRPLTVGDHKGTLSLAYDTGEEVQVGLYGAAQDANIRLDKNSLRIENTYISMANQRTVVITNHSNIITHFRWSKFATNDDEEQQKLLEQIELDREENSDTDRFLEECLTDPMLRDKLSILSRTFQNRKKDKLYGDVVSLGLTTKFLELINAVENNTLLFNDDIISIDPVEGDIWPNSTLETTVVFKPREAISYTRIAYCDITGRESRLPLRIRGDGIGPKVEFSFEHLEMGNIFIGSKHTYEVVIANKGYIDAIYSVVPNDSIFGPCFALNPGEGIVMPGGHQAIEVTFCSPYLGDFEEIFCIQVDGQPQQYTVKFSGRVVGPTFNFDVSQLKFGTVSLGFLTSQVCRLMNTSLVPMVFNLRVPGDGTNKSVCCTDDIDTDTLQIGVTPATDPKEFEIIPSTGVIPPRSEIEVEVQLVPNTIKKHDTSLVVDVDRVGESIISLPISAKSAIPDIRNATPILNYGRCFIRHPYRHFVTLQNDSELAAKYELAPQVEENDPPISFRSTQPKGIIAPHSTTNMPLSIMANALGEQEIVCFIKTFGNPNPIAVNVICAGEGPVVHVNPHSLNWGEIPVLVDSERTLTLSNESFIPAKFKAQILRSNTVFKVSPCEGEIPPEQSLVLQIKVNLDDCVRFQDKLIINFLDSQTRHIPLQASGKGTTIVSDPPLGPVLNLGPSFSNTQLQQKFKLTNKGRRIQQLVWLTDGHLAKAKKEPRKSIVSSVQKKSNGAFQEPSNSVFQLTPSRMELDPGESIDILLEGFVSSPQSVSEHIVCHAIIGRVGGKVPIITVNIRADFIEPLLDFSTKCAFFRVDKAPNEELVTEEKQLILRNVSRLPLTVNFQLPFPFSMVIDGQRVYETQVCLHSEDAYTLYIDFEPKFKDDCHIRTIDEVLRITYLEHPHVDSIDLHGEVYFPNLEFEKTTVDFGCILNDTEVTRYINITNVSPMEVHYHWSFLVGDVATFVKKICSVKPKRSSDAGDMNSEDNPDVSVENEELAEANGDLELETLSYTEKIETDEEHKQKEEEKRQMEDDTRHPERALEVTFQGIDHHEKKFSLGGRLVEQDGNRTYGESEERVLAAGFDAPEKGQLDQKEKPDHEGGKDGENLRRSSVFSHLSLLDDRMSLERNNVLMALLEEDEMECKSPIGVEEVFDILPLYGCLQPGETEQVTFTFYGHANISGEVCAVCNVEDGPTYNLKLTGEASRVEYSFSSKFIEIGKQMYDQTSTSTITLVNTGKVGFEFSALNMDPSLEKRLLPGHPVMLPHSGYIEPLAQQEIEVRFLPGVPEFFHKTFQIQVAHFKPDTISITGEGVFPRVSLDLPRLNDEVYASLLIEAKENLRQMFKDQQEKPEPDSNAQQEDELKLLAEQETSSPSQLFIKEREPTELELQLEVERLAVRNFVQETSSTLETDNASTNAYVQKKKEHEQHISKSTADFLDNSASTKIKPILPDYLLDFGYVVLGTVRTHVIRATNTGWFPVSFKLERQSIHHAGFHTHLDRVRNLPGAPDNETLDFVISFDPRGSNLHLGEVEVIVPITIVKGPIIVLRLRAHVTMPDMKISDDVLEFSEVKCGECKVVTVQLHNHQMVKCEWDSTPIDDRKKLEKHVPMHLRRKMRQSKKQPNIFEVLPPTGILLPGQRINVQVKFMPTEEKHYENRIQFRIAESSQRILLLCHGCGLEPRLDFERTIVHFEPILPHSIGDEQAVVVSNPCTFPIEFYSLEFDTNYLYEERVLRIMRGYDEYNTLLLPPRQISDKLPQELMDYYDELFKKLEEEEKARLEAEAILEAERREREEQERQQAEMLAEPTPVPLAVEVSEIMKKVERKEKKKINSGVEATKTPETENNANNSTEQEIEGQPDTDAEDLVVSSQEDVVKSQLDTSSAMISTTTVGDSFMELQTPSAEVVAVGPTQEDFQTELENHLEEKMKKARSIGPGVGELEITPVSAAIARYLGIDLTSDGKAARNRRGIAIVVQGAPLSGKTKTAVALAKHYEAALLTVDNVVCDAIASGNTPAGLKARELCSNAARSGENDGVEGDRKVDGLSVEAVAAHTQAGLAANKKAVNPMVDPKTKLAPGVKNTIVNSSLEGATTSQVPSSPPMVGGPISRRLSISASVAGEDGLVSCVLPDDLLVEILAERLQLNDCYKGVVFDGLETLFSLSYLTTANAILKAFNNRRFIFFCTLKLDYSVLKEQEEKAIKQKELEELEKENMEIKWLEEMDEEEYDALEEEERARIDAKMLTLKKERLKRENEKSEREKHEREAREEEERKKEEEKNRGRGRKAKAPAVTDKDKKQPSVAGKGGEQAKKAQAAKSTEGEKGQDRPESIATEKSDIPTEKKKEKGKKELKQSTEIAPPLQEVKDPAKEAELLLIQRFQNFEAAQKDIQDLLELWDRSTLQPRRTMTPSERSEEDQKDFSGGKKSKLRGIDKADKDKFKEAERLRQEKELSGTGRSVRTASEETVTTDLETEKKEDLGVPNIMIDCSNMTFVQPTKIVKSEILASVTESLANPENKFGNKNKSSNTKSSNHNQSNNLASTPICLHKTSQGSVNTFGPRQSVMDGLGLGPQGPPIPPPVTFSVVPYPVKRRPPAIPVAGGQYIFVASAIDDPNIGAEVKDAAAEVEVKEEEKAKLAKAQEKGGRISIDAKADNKRSAERKKTPVRGSTHSQSPQPGPSSSVTELESQSIAVSEVEEKVPSTPLTVFRWTVPAGSEVTLRLKFTSKVLGRFDQTLNFEIVGTRRRYQVFCRGVCSFPGISREPRVVFPNRKKTRGENKIVHKKFIMSSETFEFGPLLVGKSRDRYREGKYPENKEDITILNNSPMEADASFCFLKDSKGDTFLLEPASMTLKPGESGTLTIWAYPKVPDHYEDVIVCCVCDNPEPVLFKVSCYGFRPELEMDKKVLQFDRVLLHRKDTKTIFLQNSTQLPVAWKLSGLETLGDEFTVAADSGVVEPLSEYPLHAYFRAMKAIPSTKKMIRIEISDADNILGVVHTEPIQVIYEAYDVALDMSFPKDSQPSKKNEKVAKPASPEEKKGKAKRVLSNQNLPTFSLFAMKASKGTDGGLDFGVVKAADEAKQICTLKNKGRYEIAYNFTLENPNQTKLDLASLFSVVPSSGKLNPADRPTQVQVIFKSSREVVIKDMPILKCKVIEPSLGEQGETIASIPVRVSVKVVFSRFSIVPSDDINFGSLLVGSKKTRTFTIENKGEFDFKYIIFKRDKDFKLPASFKQQSKGPTKLNKGQEDALANKSKRSESVRLADANKDLSKVTLGMFTLYPTFGIILPRGNQVITVDCAGEAPGKDVQDVCVEITDRDPDSFKDGITYQLIAEACIPTINVDDVCSIFEEHRICKNLSVWQHVHRGQSEVGGIYGEEEKKFVFNNVIVGRPAKARFKIASINKVPCDVIFTLKPIAQKENSKSLDVFEVDPPRIQISNNSHIYVTVTFTPQSMQSYSTMFEASIEGSTPNQAKGKSLIFEISGEGNLPRITVAKPAIRNKRGQPLLLFKRILIGRSESLPLELLNEGTLCSKVDIDLHDPDKCFVLRPTQRSGSSLGDMDDTDLETRNRPHTASVIVNPNETATFEVIYRPLAPVRSQASLKVTVEDNQYEDCIVQIVGQGFQDDITLDNIGSVFVPTDHDLDIMTDDDLQAAQPNVMQFGDCYLNEDRTLNLTMTNHSKSDCVRFQWPLHPALNFSPQVGHLHASCTKDIAVTFNSASPQIYVKCPVPCLVSKIKFDKPIDQVCDWDDKLQVVKWVDAFPAVVQLAESDKPEDEMQEGQRVSIEEVMEILLFGSKSTSTNPVVPYCPTKKKVIEVETEPKFTEVPDSARNVELLVSAISDCAKCSCQVTSIHFKDTLMFQTRVYSIIVENVGNVALEYNWQASLGSFISTRAPSAAYLLKKESVTVSDETTTTLSKNDRSESRMTYPDDSYIPFLVEPDCGTIPAGKTAQCVIKYAPLEAKESEGRLVCRIANLSEDDQCPVIALKGRSLVPYCHFDLEDSDYISSARRNPELRGPRGAPPGSALDPSTRVIEFDVCGTGVKSCKEFGIVNPTNKSFFFEWVCEDETDTKQPTNFRCLKKEGEILSGRKFKVGFEYVSRGLDIVESFWRFVIPSESISLPFLLVGNTREPDVSLDRSHLNFKSLLIGYKANETVYLTNNEDTWFSFSFDENSCHSEGYASHLTVEPIRGQVSAKSSVPINLYFLPTSEREVNFNLRCVVSRKVAPLTLNVKAEGYSMNSVLLFEDSTGGRVEFTDQRPNQINFGEVEISETAIRHLFIINSGKFNFDYDWEMDEATASSGVISISPKCGGVLCGETQQFSLMFCPHKRTPLKDCELQLKVVNGRTYQLSVAGLGVSPGLQFSFLSYNFGNCFTHKPGLDLSPKQVVLQLKNKDKKEISVSCLYVPTSHLTHKFESHVVAPNHVINIKFTFSPRHAVKYHETVIFEINGLSRQKVEFFGTGIEMKIEVADPKHRCVNLGARMFGDSVRKFIPIVNNSPVPVTFNLAFTPSEPALQSKEVLSVCPTEPITLFANGGTTKVEVWFRPKARIPQFTEEVLLECAAVSQPLFVLKGSCLGMEISLDSDSISFGTVFQRSSSSRKLVMSNTGDMNTKFRWDIKHFKPDFSIFPVEGYITPGMDVSFNVEFHPQTISADVRYNKLKCLLDGGPHKPITLTLAGSCTGIPPVKEVQSFQAVVRQTDTKQIMIPNRSNQLWILKPIIDGEFWTGPVTLTVEPQQTKAYDLTYRPLTMTLDSKKHVGSLFFPLPDGSGLLFNLSGTSDAPRAVAKIQRDVPCKTSYTELISVANWLKKPQRFRVKIESMKEKLDASTTVKGVEYIDVPADSKKDYKLSFYAFKEGITSVKVTFTNELTGEYQFYEVTFRSTRPSTIASLELSTLVRQSLPYVVNIENPLPSQVSFQISCTVAEILIPNQFSVPANSLGQFNFEYQPLKVGVVTGRLELNSSELGVYIYDLILTATPGAPEKAVYFSTSLGSNVTQVARFLNFAKLKVDYTCKIENQDFHVEKTVAAAPGSTGGTEVVMDVFFEPSMLGEQRAMLLVSSSIGGEYMIPLFGTCDPPKPQGPFTVKTGTSTPIIFKNVFNTTTQFTFQVDNPLFHVTKQSESIRSHKEQRIVVSFDGSDVRSKAAVMGKLIVSCAHTAGGSSNVQWMYYLKGVTP